MNFLTDGEFWARWLGIVVIDLTLAGDNALLIALAVRSLPARQQFWGRILGTFGAVGLRLAFIAVISLLIEVPYLRLAGGLLLVWIAFRLVRPTGQEHGRVRSGHHLLEAVWIIVVADVVMSLDNVLAIAGAASGDMVLVIFGIALSLPLVVWGSGLLARLMNRWPCIIWLGGGVLGYIAGEMVFHDQVVQRALGPLAKTLALPAAIGLAVAVAAAGWRHDACGGKVRLPTPGRGAAAGGEDPARED